jgi:hypothetical protein
MEAVKWIRKAAEQGSDKAQFTLGAMYLKGDGLVKSDNAAMSWFRKSAKQGNLQAQYNLGLCLWDSEDEELRSSAITWMERAAHAGYAPAQCELGIRYITGEGLPQSDPAALRWFSLSAEQGYVPAQYNLAVLYLYGGSCLSPDESSAFQWFSRAAKEGYRDAQFYLGCLYERGNAVSRDVKAAKTWLTMAMEGGSAEAREVLNEMERDEDFAIGKEDMPRLPFGSDLPPAPSVKNDTDEKKEA